MVSPAKLRPNKTLHRTAAATDSILVQVSPAAAASELDRSVQRRIQPMTIDDDHLYHGAALIQIAEDPQFTAINSLALPSGVSRSAYRINDSIAVYLKYASKPKGAVKEYQFTFTKEHLDELEAISEVAPDLFVALVCVQAREICCLTYAQLNQLIGYRRTDVGHDEDQYVVLVTMPKGKSFRAYVNAAGVRNRFTGKQLIIARNAFPGSIFT
jgi:hypothetical protein